jgi:hypothetical protein
MKVISFFPRMINKYLNEDLFSRVTKEELGVILQNFKKDRIPGPDEWTVEFYTRFFDLISDDLLRVVE